LVEPGWEARRGDEVLGDLRDRRPGNREEVESGLKNDVGRVERGRAGKDGKKAEGRK
jgi:hypothetical protein